MRNVLTVSALALCLGLIGCGDDTDTQIDMQGDIAKVQLDLTVPPKTDTCGDLIGCGNACTTQACITACIKEGTASAQSTYNALGDCIDKACPSGTVADGGAAKPCDFNAAGTMLLDKVACDKCVSDAQKTGGSCKAALDACTADGA